MDKGEAGADGAELARAVTELAQKSQRVMQRFLERQAQGDTFQIPDPVVVGDAFVKLSQAMLADPGRLVQAQMQLWQQMGELWHHQIQRAKGEATEPLIESDQADRRFKDEDHIAPWRSTYRGSLRLGGAVKFVLGGSGHIAGVINPPSSAKYGYWINPKRPNDPDRWLATATAHEGSWWTDWAAWLSRKSGPRVAPRVPGSGSAPVLEAAPGRYVRVRSD